MSRPGRGTQLPPQVFIMIFRNGFWSKLIRTMKTLHSMPPTMAQANDRADPHCPAPVSVVSFLMPNCLLYHACGMAVLGL